MKIDRYEVQYNSATHRNDYYAIAGKRKIPMPPEFAEMYTDDYLEITETVREMPEVFDSTDVRIWIPRKTR